MNVAISSISLYLQVISGSDQSETRSFGIVLKNRSNFAKIEFVDRATHKIFHPCWNSLQAIKQTSVESKGEDTAV